MTSKARRGLPRLPRLADDKLMKTGYTRGATVREVYQNRVTRNNPVLVPWEWWHLCKAPDDGSGGYENGALVLVRPAWYFDTPDADAQLAAEGLELGVNALLLYRLRADWERYRPTGGRLPNGKEFRPATARRDPLGGVYFARVHGTVADDGLQVTEGFDTKDLRGAGIRVYEYASRTTIGQAKLQLETLLWLCADADVSMVRAGMTDLEVEIRRTAQFDAARQQGLLDLDRLRTLRLVDADHHTICPLCLERISIAQFLSRMEQAQGRETPDLTVTEVSLFHIQELRVGRSQHKPYNLGWGHHHCNVVVKDAGIMPTLRWMRKVLDNQPPLSLDEETRLVEEAVER